MLVYLCWMGFDDVARRMKERHRGEIDYAPASGTTDPDRIVAGAAGIDSRASGGGDLVLGAILLVIGIAITAITHDAASGEGSTYVIAYGPILVGSIQIIRGLARSGG